LCFDYLLPYFYHPVFCLIFCHLGFIFLSTVCFFIPVLLISEVIFIDFDF
jgi:hypothetical protein